MRGIGRADDVATVVDVLVPPTLPATVPRAGHASTDTPTG
ncbi:hypothetical protein EV378_3070 [Pseudonocardia endophytica]|uniref:Uncharacterized protein n=1 Tax=Pseudonocardia endophytica TaxID=401976 RepID=A0A4R1I038_PSEEN|nr:hypothetical protein EV378_3070 [Pseudonocardia endophytica]